jgi:signal transduction histidine kinase
MNPEEIRPEVLEAPIRRERTWFYPWIGLLFGMILGIFIGHPLSMLVHDFYGYINSGTPLDFSGAFLHSFHWHMWPMMLIFGAFGGIVWGFIGFILQHLRESRLRLDTLHQEFELQVATLRHHYKNLAIGIHGFSSRIKKKLAHMDKTLHDCLVEGDCPTYERLHPQLESLNNNMAILEKAAQRLTHTLAQELLFLKALTSSALPSVPRDFYPFLIHCVDDLLGLRFREKEIQVEINGHPLKNCQDSLAFPFEPHTMEVILQNVLANAMRYGDHIHLNVTDGGDRLRVEIRDNGPGLNIQELKRHLVTSWEQREAESTHLGLRVSIHLLAKIGGRLLAWSQPGAGAIFVIEFPKHFLKTP